MSVKQDHKRWRKAFYQQCLKRDSFSCVLCGDANAELEVHHITPRTEMPNYGYSPSNGISLCSDCHKDAEKYLSFSKIILGKDRYLAAQANSWLVKYPDYSPEYLYSLIGSSYETAFEESKDLK